MTNRAHAWINAHASKYWACEPRALEGFMASLAGHGDTGQAHQPALAAATVTLDPGAVISNATDQTATIKLAAPAAPSGTTGPSYQVVDSIAIIPVTGILLDEVEPWMSEFGIDATSYEDIAAAVRAAVADPSVDSIVLRVTSPGGIIDGVFETAYEIADARRCKPVHAYIENLGASAAYWLASQAAAIGANQTAMVGSIGVYTVAVDLSAMAAALGVKVHVISTGPHKGAGVQGAPLTPEQIAAIQENINALGDDFVYAVARGRSQAPDAVRANATGQCWHSQAALTRGLVDSVQSLTTFLAGVPRDPNSNTGAQAMGSENNAAAQVTVDAAAIEAAAGEKAMQRCNDLLAAFPDDRDYAIEAFKAGHSVDQAKAGYCAILQTRVKGLQEQIVGLNRDLAAANDRLKAQGQFHAGAGAAVPPGEPPKTGAADPVEAFNAAVERIMTEKKCTKSKARSLAANDRDLYSAYKAELERRSAR